MSGHLCAYCANSIDGGAQYVFVAGNRDQPAHAACYAKSGAAPAKFVDAWIAVDNQQRRSREPQLEDLQNK